MVVWLALAIDLAGEGPTGYSERPGWRVASEAKSCRRVQFNDIPVGVQEKINSYNGFDRRTVHDEWTAVCLPDEP